MILQGHNRYPVNEVVLHCAGIKTNQFARWGPVDVRAEIDRWHKAKGWKGIGYHAIAMPDGSLVSARPLDEVGAHVKEANRGTVGLLLIENRQIDHIGVFDNWFTAAQRLAVLRFVRWLPGVVRVTGHNDYARKLCPGFRVVSNEWL